MQKKEYKKRQDELNKKNQTALRQIRNNGEVLNYTKLCEEIGIEPYAGGQAGGRQIEQHLKFLHRYAVIRRVGKGYLVEKVRNEVLDPPKRKQRKVKYKDAVTCLDYNITRSTNTIVKRSKNRLIKDAGFVNQNFVVAAANMQATAELLGINIKALDSIINYFGTRFKLNAKELLKRSRAVQTCKIDGKKEVIEALMLAYQNGNKVANDKEVAMVQQVERVILDGLECKTKQGAYMKGLWHEFTRRVNSILERRHNILYTYNGYQMRVRHKAIKTTPNTYNKARTRLAEQVEASVLKSVNRAMLKNAELDEKFLEDIKKLIEVVIKPTSFNLQAELTKVA